MQHSEKHEHPVENKSSSQSLKIDSPNSAHEKEAESVAEIFSRNGQIMGSENIMKGQIAGNPNSNNGMIAPAGVQEKINSTKRSGDRLLDSVKRLVKGKSGELDEVRIHTDNNAAVLSQAVSAKAFTHGKDIYFGQGMFNTYSAEGKELLVHELMHAKGNNSEDSSLIQRTPVTTYWGTWDTDKYSPIVNPKDPTEEYGLDIILKFTPGDKVNCGKIGMVQTIKSVIDERKTFPSLDYNDYEKRSLDGDLKSPINKTFGTTEEGFAIDRTSPFNDPTFQSDKYNATDTTLGGGDEYVENGKKVNGTYGKRINSGNNWIVTPSTLLDGPQLPDAGYGSMQVFETAAIGLESPQSGVYMSSIKWGWKKESGSKIIPIPIEKVSESIPSATFFKSAKKWNDASTGGNATIDLPLYEGTETTKTMRYLKSLLGDFHYDGRSIVKVAVPGWTKQIAHPLSAGTKYRIAVGAGLRREDVHWTLSDKKGTVLFDNAANGYSSIFDMEAAYSGNYFINAEVIGKDTMDIVSMTSYKM
jgi:hypothetical protein